MVRFFAVLFLAISAFVEFACFFLYAYLFPKLPIVKHFRQKAASEGSKTVAADLAAAGVDAQSDQAVLPTFLNPTSLFKSFITISKS